MKLNNKGFALTSIIYMLIVLFLMIMLLVLSNLAQRKVVLDKIKNDVKNELNQGGILASNRMIVTFDPQGGEINQTAKQVTYNEPYGELPTPTKEGYVFRGWRGKNLFDKSDALYAENSWIDTSGTIHNENPYSIYKIQIDENKTYTITNSGKVRTPGYNIYDKSGNVLQGQSYNLNETLTFTTPENSDYILVSVITDPEFLPYYDKDYFQLEEGSTATSYEPYQEYTSDTIVTKQENHTLYAIWKKDEATFVNGGIFNAKIKQLAGNENATATTIDTNIKSIQRTNALPQIELNDGNIISTNDSSLPIYVWFNNGTIYYYTEATNPYMNSNGSGMFRDLRAVETIEINTIDTSKTIYMAGMFYNPIKLQRIDLTNFDTKSVQHFSNMFASWDFTNNVGIHSELKEIIGIENFDTQSATTMESMFADSSIENLDLSKWNTENLENTKQMFMKCTNLKSLNISKFDMSQVTNTSYMLTATTALQELKTPKVYPTDSSVTIELPKTMYDTSNNSYTTLGSGSPTETVLKDTQTQ